MTLIIFILWFLMRRVRMRMKIESTPAHDIGHWHKGIDFQVCQGSGTFGFFIKGSEQLPRDDSAIRQTRLHPWCGAAPWCKEQLATEHVHLMNWWGSYACGQASTAPRSWQSVLRRARWQRNMEMPERHHTTAIPSHLRIRLNPGHVNAYCGEPVSYGVLVPSQ